MKPKLLLVFLLLLANLTAKSYALGINVVEVPAPNIEFADANVKAICVANWDTNNDGELSHTEAAAVTNFGTVFKNNTQITSFDELQYFTGLTSIGYQAFSFCSGLTSVTISNSVTSIGGSAFEGCSSLTSINIPNSVTSIGDWAFSGCRGLTSVSLPNSITTIGEYAFGHCSGLTSLTIPNSVTSIGEDAFRSCSGLTSVNISNSLTDIGRVFIECSGLEAVTIPDGVESIGEYAFDGCTSLTSLTISQSVTSINNKAFLNCGNLETIVVDEHNTTYDSRNHCNAIIKTSSNTFVKGCKNTIIPEDITFIGNYAFYGCNNLSITSFPESVSNFGEYAFAGATINEIVIPTSVTYIGKSCFSNATINRVEIPYSETPIRYSCSEGSNYAYTVFTKATIGTLIIDRLLSQVLSSEYVAPFFNTQIDKVYEGIHGQNWYSSSTIQDYYYPEGITDVKQNSSFKYMGSGMYYSGGNSTIERLHIPEGVTTITKIYMENPDNTSVNIPSTVTTIAADAFESNMYNTLVLPAGIQSIGERAFANITSVKSITCLAENPIEINENVFPSNAFTKPLYVPVGSKGLYEVASGWSNFTNIIEIGELGNPIQFADPEIKSRCVKNYDVNGDGELSEGEALLVTSIKLHDSNSNSSNSSITSFDELGTYFTNLTSIDYYAFGEFRNMTSITIPNSVTSIGVDAFYDCIGLTSVTIPSNVTSIAATAFRSSGLSTIVVDPNNTTYDSRDNCNAIIETASNTLVLGCKNTVIPNSVTSIGEFAFSGCSGLTALNIPNSVTSIGNYAFGSCNGLTSVVSKIEEPFTFGSSAFSYISSTCTLTVPAGTRDAYIAAGWTENVFKGGIVEAEPEYAYNVSDDITSLATAEWEGKTGDYSGLANTVERYTHGTPEDVGDILTQTISGLRNGTYRVQLETAASFTSGRGFECPTGDGLSVAFANGTQRNLPVLDRVAVREGEQKLVTLTATVTDGTLKYGIKNLAPSGNWFVARLKSIVYVSADAQSPQTYAISIAPEENGTTTTDVTADEEGSKVFITTTPDESCNLESLKVTTTSGQELEVTNNWFIMPASAVTVTATYILRQPFDGELTLPGTLEAENYDTGGEGFTYHDNEPENQGDGNYRQNEGVDIVAGNDGYAVGWTNEGEWIEYTVNVIEAGKYTYEATVSSGVEDGGGFSISLVGEDGSLTTLADVSVPQTSDWETYQTVTGELLQEFTTGTQIIRITCTTANCNIDKVKFDVALPTIADLTTEMFHLWTLEEPVTIADGDDSYGSLNLHQYGGLIYGDGNVNPNQFADLSGWDYLTIAATNGTPRLIFNRIYNPEAEEGSEEWKGADWLEINNTENEYVESAENGVIVYDLKAIREDCDGMVRLHAIKDADGPFIVHALKLSTISPAEITWNNIEFADANVKGLCVANWDTDGDEELNEYEASLVTDLGEVFTYTTFITSFNELQYFTGLEGIGTSAFYCCGSLTSIVIPNSVTSIGMYAFWGCTGLTSIDIPNSVTSIGMGAFSRSGLSSIEIPNSVTSISNLAFVECSDLISIIVDDDNLVYDSREDCNAIIETESNTLITGCKNSFIPESVTSIGEKAFYFCGGLTSIDIPNSVTSIGTGAFQNCSLSSIEIPSSVTSIGNLAFAVCGDLISIIVDDDNLVYDSRENCNAIIETESNTLIAGCKNSFIPESVTSIGETAFSYCSDLTSVEIPNSVTSIGASAFNDCSGLTSVSIPNSVTSIGDKAFGGCGDLTSVVSEIEEPCAFGSDAFTGVASTCTLTVPYGTRDAYIAAGWTEDIFQGGIMDAPAPSPVVADLTTEMFHLWTLEEPVTIVDGDESYGSINLHKSDINIYGDFGVDPDQFADLSGWDYLTIAATNGTPRLIFNRIYNPEAEEGSEEWKGADWLEINNTENEYVESAENGVIVYDLKAIREDCDGMVRLHAIKGADDPVIVHAMKLSTISPAEIDWNNIEFADANVKAICVANWDTDNDGKLSMEEAAAVTDLGEVFKENTTITSFDELQYFTGLESICNEAFNGCSNLTSVVLPEGLKSINYKSFCSTGLKSIKFPASLEWAGTLAFINTPLESIDFNGCAANVGEACFQGNHVEDLYIPNTVKFVDYNNLAWSWLKHVTFEAFEEGQEPWKAALLFAGCTNLESVVLPTTAVMEDNFFEECRGLTSITFLKVEDNFDIMTKNYARMLGGVPYTNYVKVNIPEGYAEQFLRAGYYNLSDLSGLPFAREEFESEAARISSMAEQLSSGDMQALTTAISNARTIVNAAEEYLTIYAQINAIKDAAKIYVNSTNLTKGDDLTAAYILNPDFDRFQFGWNIFSGWDSRGVKFGDSGSGDVKLENFVEAVYGGGLGEGQIAQTITNLPAGIYRLEMDAQADTWSEEVPVTGTTFFAGTSSTSVSTKPYYPEHFSVRFENPATQSVTVGINLANSNAKYVSADNFRLYYEGEVAPPPAGTELVSSEDETYYIYNVEAGMFLNAGNSWGTHAVLAETGLPVRMTQDSDGYWEIFFRKGSTNQQKLFVTDDNNEVYVDWADGVPPRWQIAPLDGSYTIQYMSDEGTSYVLGNDPNRQDFDWQNNTTRDTHIDVIRTNNATNHTRWQFIKATDYDLAMAKRQLFATICRMEQSDVDNDDLLSNGEAIYYDANATLAEVIEAITLLNSQMGMPKENAPVDMTAMIINPAFEKNTTEGWTDATRGCTDSRVQEFKQNFNMYQQVVGVPNGRYRLKYKGFHRAGSEMGPASAVVYANDVQKTLKHICDGASDTQLQGWDELSYDGQYIPGGQGAARKYFDAGLYADYLEVEVTDNILTIGVKNTEEMGANHWVCFSDFELEILENAEQLENRLIVEDCRGISGGKATMKIAMENVADVAGLEFKVKLPEGVNFDLVGGTPKVSKTSRMTGMIVSTSLIGDYAKVLVIPKLPEEEGAPLPVVTGNSGTIANFVLTIGNSLELGDYELEVKDIIIGKSDGLMIKQISSAKATLTLVNAGQGDANRDSNVDVGDIITIANTILGNPPANFDAAAADVNGDGDINVGDIIALANIILRGGEEFDPQ